MVKLGPQINFPTEVQTSGEFWYRITDPPLFLTQIAGSLGNMSSGDVSTFIRSYFLEQFLQELSKYSGVDVYSHLEETSSKIKTSNIIEGFRQRGLELIDLKISSLTMPFFDELMKDPTYGLPLHIALQSGDMNKVMDMVKTVESMRALGKSGGASTVGALFAVPQMLGAQQYAPPPYPPQYAQPYPPQYAQQPAPQQQPSASPQPQTQGESGVKSPLEKLRELKQMLDEGFITQDEFDKTKNEILSQMKK
jgi:membrane protease subunit (stomatin/prohibitin family)